jgi:hypothetical protein
MDMARLMMPDGVPGVLGHSRFKPPQAPF